LLRGLPGVKSVAVERRYCLNRLCKIRIRLFSLARYCLNRVEIGEALLISNSMPFASDNEIAAIGCGVLNLSLPKSKWTHEAHFAAALWLISCRQDLDARRDMPGFIRAYNEATGVANTDTEGYHETITQASLRAALSFLAQHPQRALFATCNALMASPLGRSDWLLQYWSRGRLFSVEARRKWVEPDLKPLPF
jgi:hypothetical protein